MDTSGNTPLHVAVSEQSIACVKALIDPANYTSKSNQLQIDTCNYEGSTALHLSILDTNFAIFQILEAAGASVYLCDSKQGDSVLHMAVQQNFVVLVQHLLEHTKFDVSLKNHSNYTALGLALSADPVQPQIVNMLTDYTEEEKPEITDVSKS